MKKHSGMRPQDVLILLKIIAPDVRIPQPGSSKPGFKFLPRNAPSNKSIAKALQISEAEVSESLRRSTYAGLLNDPKKKKVYKKALLDFIFYGLKYVFPTHPGPLARGVPTAHSVSPLKDIIISDENYVWQDAEGTVRGQIIEPLYPTVPSIATQDKNLYELLALTDAIRTGTGRTVSIAAEELEKRIMSA